MVFSKVFKLFNINKLLVVQARGTGKCNSNNKDSKSKNNNEKVIALNEIHRFIRECFEKLGVKKENAKLMADGLVAADYRGIYSHGLSRLEPYIKDITNKVCDPNACPKIMMETVSTAAVNGNNGLGTVIGAFCMDLAIKKASETGIAIVVTNGSNHFGINMFYTERAAEKGFIGMAFTNTSPVMVPAGAKDVCLGTNPISIAAPGEGNDRMVMDIATTAVSFGKIQTYNRNKKQIPLGWGLDEHGKETTDPELVVKSRKLMPLGGNVSYKGTGFALMVECLSGLLADANYGPNIRQWGQKTDKPANLGHGFIAIDPQKFPAGFQKRLSDLLNYIRKMQPVDPNQPVMVPGDLERKIMEKVNKQGGITYTPTHISMVEKISKELGVKGVKFK
ncbi:uncharacterized oxidoreductase YjmC-like isoform X1 [Diabrotica virgifera virgifera]|uniref:Malate dehydrogenase n=1 Tax=Diabrotica virgifera virgifera TaxID=50390 RepID=A0ABM5K4F4_DIAVI|nr:uncharacterized oxidoreductase YjmC-like isoform X1 [Diabrotica virgifera virgifera]